MPFIYSELDVDGRLKHVQTQTNARDFEGNQVVNLRLLELVPDHDLETEVDALVSHLPGYVTALGGESEEGTSWVIILERWSADNPTSLEFGSSYTGFAALDLHLRRALELNPVWTLVMTRGMSSSVLGFRLSLDSGGAIASRSLSATNQLRALAVQGCGYSFPRLALSLPTGCAFPDEEHRCTGEVYTDAFQGWNDNLVKLDDEL